MKFLIASGFWPNSMEFSCVAELRNLGHEVVEFRTQAGRLARTVLLNRLSRRAMNRHLVEVTKAERPDIVMTINGKDIEPRTVAALPHEPRTVNWSVGLPQDRHERAGGTLERRFRYSPCRALSGARG